MAQPTSQHPATGKDDSPAAGIIRVTCFRTKSDMSGWAREHADAPGINWNTAPGPGGELIVTEYEDGCTVPGRQTAGAES